MIELITENIGYINSFILGMAAGIVLGGGAVNQLVRRAYKNRKRVKS